MPAGPGTLWPPSPSRASEEKGKRASFHTCSILNPSPPRPTLRGSVRFVSQFGLMSTMHISPTLVLASPPRTMIRKQVGGLSSRPRRGVTLLHMCCDLFIPVQVLCKLCHGLRSLFTFPQGHGSLSSPSSGFNVGLPSALPSLSRGSFSSRGKQALLPAAASMEAKGRVLEPFLSLGKCRLSAGWGFPCSSAIWPRTLCYNTGNDSYF